MASDPRANLKPLSLHVPEPKFRPGDVVDFADIEVPPAGAGRRPDVAEGAAAFPELAYGLVRVLDDEARAVGPWDPRLSPDMLRRMLRAMALTRAYDERMRSAEHTSELKSLMRISYSVFCLKKKTPRTL